MLDIQVKVDEKQRKQAKELLAHIPGGAAAAMARALNRTVEGVRTEVIRAITASFVVKAGKARDTMSVQRATPQFLFARLTSRGPSIGLEQFSWYPKSIKPRPPIGVSVQIDRERRAWARPGSFLVDNGRLFGLYVRRANDAERRKFGQRSIQKLTYTPGIPGMMRRVLEDNGFGSGNRRLQEKANQILMQRVDHEVEYLLKKGKK